MRHRDGRVRLPAGGNFAADRLPERAGLRIAGVLLRRQPAPDVRTVERMLAHIAGGRYEFRGAAEGTPGIEKTARTSADIVAAMKAALAYCDGVFAGMTDAGAVGTVTSFGRRMAGIHYGNRVTYMRFQNIVPPSSEGRE